MYAFKRVGNVSMANHETQQFEAEVTIVLFFCWESGQETALAIPVRETCIATSKKIKQ